jgi:hypothetical protein
MAKQPQPKPEPDPPAPGPDPDDEEAARQPAPGRQQLTFGEKAVGLTFNPSGDPIVARIKQLYAQIIDLCDDERKKVNAGRITAAAQQHEAARLWSIAITEAQSAQMWAVKAATWRD